jgi:hypothetical protein
VEKGWGKSYEDCSECPHRDTCGKLGNEEEEEEEQAEASEEESAEPAEESVATSLTAAADEDKPSKTSRRRPATFKNATEANYNQVLERMSPIALLRFFLKLSRPAHQAPDRSHNSACCMSPIT